jgi:hypothetical protein
LLPVLVQWHPHHHAKETGSVGTKLLFYLQIHHFPWLNHWSLQNRKFQK